MYSRSGRGGGGNSLKEASRGFTHLKNRVKLRKVRDHSS